MAELEPLIEKSGLDPSPGHGRDQPTTGLEFGEENPRPTSGDIDWSSDTQSNAGQTGADDSRGLVALLSSVTHRNETILDAEQEPWRTYGETNTNPRFADRDSNTSLAAASHLLGLFTSVVGPGIIYLVSNDRFVKRNAANAMNWQLMVVIYTLGSVALGSLLTGALQSLVGLFAPAVILLDLAFVALSGSKASDGIAWEYPLTPSIR